MKLEYITKPEFDFLKDNLIDWVNKKLVKDPDTIFQFSSDLTNDDRNYIYQRADGFIIKKSKVLEIDHFEKIETPKEKETTDTKETSDKTSDDDSDGIEIKYEIIMRAGRKYHNKLQRYPIKNMGVINIINDKMDIQTLLLGSIFIMNSIMFLQVMQNHK